ncbi:MAG: hypothetical protein RL169_1359 [Armatimonadota bacterium]
MSKRLITLLCFAVIGGVFAGCKQKAEDAAASAPTATRAESDGLTQAPGAQPAPQAQMPAGSMGTTQPATGSAGAQDDH